MARTGEMCRVYPTHGSAFHTKLCAATRWFLASCVMMTLAVSCVRPSRVPLVKDVDYVFEEEIENEIPCPDPEQITNGETIVWGDGLLLEYRCKGGYFAVGITHGACDLSTGTWTIDPPVCVDKGCPEITPPSHGVVSIDNSGGIATIICRPSYFLLGDSTLICEAGQWRGVFPVCAVIAKPNEKTKSRKDREKSAVRSSNSDHSLEDSDETCFYSQIMPPEIEHSVVDTSYVLNEIRHRYVMVASYTCMGRFKLRNSTNNQLFCKNLVWSSPVWPECIAEDDPCEIDNGGCHHYCTPLDKEAYSCSCYDGYNLAGDAKQCIDTDECAIGNGDCQQECFNTEGSYFCACSSGFVPQGSKCLDIDECAKSESLCPGPCINLPGSFKCDCDIEGYTGTDSMDHCKDIDECATENGGCDDLCINTRGSFECRCEAKGRKLGVDGRSCVDVDECSRYKTKVCSHGQCVNTDGWYRCVCNNGYKQTQNRSSCVDVDECEKDNGGCSQVCTNSPGSFRCSCHGGFTLTDDKSTCKDVNECLVKKGGCEDLCVNTPGSFKCACTHVGKVLSKDGVTCTECTRRQFFSLNTSSCVSCPVHSHSRDGLALSLQDCRCDKGFHGNPGLSVQCQDTNECETGQMHCSHECVNTIGSAYCACPEGLSSEEDGVTCRDMDECKLGISNCSQICDNAHSSYTCRCFYGYLLDNDGFTCTDVDECATGEAMCTHGCVNTDGGYTCTCQKGYQLSSNGTGCKDVNECSLDTSVCQHICVNTVGSYTCQCNGAGFKLSRDMTSCIDINECMEGDNPCPDICINTVGSYLCDCDRPGYRLTSNLTGCEDINECDVAMSPCPYKCINTPGSFKCQCPEGHQDPEGNNQTVCNKCGYGTYRGPDDDGCKRCPPRTNTTQTGSTSIKDCLCVPGYKADPGGSGLCLDIDECTTGTPKCEQGCVNSMGSFSCTCRPGFVLSADKLACRDMNECLVNNGGCEHRCVNSLGSFRCECRSNKYKLADNGLSCEDVNGCNQQEHGCEYKCTITRTGAKCTCPPGHELLDDGRKCTDTDECMSRNGGCTGTCINTPGSFRCRCNLPGYKLYTDGKQCVDINECEERNGNCEDLCVNSVGSFRCYCRKQGYILAADKLSCEDVDECARGKLCQHKCINLPGSFRCDCDAGHYKQGHHCTPCAKGSYRGIKDSVVSCALCPRGMTTASKATDSVRGCFCSPGYYGNPERQEACQDVDECGKDNGGCEHSCNNTIGSFFCTCREGYALHSDNKTCIPTRCPVLDLHKYATFTTPECRLMAQGQHVLPGTECSFKCRGSLLLKGSSKRICLGNFTWTGTQVECAGAMPCERMPVPANGYLHPALCMLPRVPFRTRCQVRCDQGYKLEGRTASRCRPFGQWGGKFTSKCVQKKSSKKP